MKKTLFLCLSMALIIPYASADFLDDTMNELGTAFDLIGKAARKATKKMRRQMDKAMRDDWTRMPDSPCTISIDDNSVRIAMQAPSVDPQELKPEIEHGIFTLNITTKDYQATIALSKNQARISTSQEQRTEKTIHSPSADDGNKEQPSEEPQFARAYHSTQTISRLIPAIDLDSISVEYEKGIVTIIAKQSAPTKNKKEVPVIVKN